MILVNRQTVALAERAAMLAHRKCRLVVLKVIKETKDPIWKQKHIEALESITAEELKYVNS